MKSFLPNDIKDQNRKIIFDIFLQEPNLAKIEVSERTTMSSVTVNKIVDFFEEIGIVTANGESREGSGGLGRKRIIYSFNPNSYLTIGIQLIGNKVAATLVNLYSEVIDTCEIDGVVQFYSNDFAELLQKIVERFQKKIQNQKSKIIGLGIGVDGAIHIHRKTIRMRTLDNQKEEDYSYDTILDKISEKIMLPIVLENDVNASTIAEFSYLDRSGDGPCDMLQIALGEGIGAGLILNKKLHRGFSNSIGELEYMCFDEEYVHNPSSVGWLESKISLGYLEKEYQFNPKQIEVLTCDQKKRCVDYISKYLALAIVNTISLLDIHNITLTGKTVIAMPDEIIETTKQYINQYTGWNLTIRAGLQDKATAVGAAILAFRSEMTKVIAGKGDEL
ncbi:MAG: sugar kinase [Herbinix sp.]|jgi:predicted NBD/HSP70 family sugar kinase|nr:sugar kinase [Herbinix sp.]